MSEQIYIYNLKNKHQVEIADRDEYYASQVKAFEESGATTHAVEIVNVFLFNPEGELLIQKRGVGKNHNPGLLDKSLGGHLRAGDTSDFAVMTETVEELFVPSLVLRDDFDFEKARGLLSKYYNNVAVLKPLATDFFMLKKIIAGKEIPIANKAHVYVGIYEGTTKPSDKEASGVLYYDLKQLKDDMEKAPDLFTHDLRFYIERFNDDFTSFVEHIAVNGHRH